MELGGRIEQLIAEHRQKYFSERQRKEREFEARRVSAIRRIIAGGKLHGAKDETIEARVRDASIVRISQVEAYAILAEQGDFSSVLWWDIKASDRTLWKGYVLRKKEYRKNLHMGSHDLQITVRPLVAETKGYIAACTCDTGQIKMVSVGIAEESHLVAAKAAIEAFKQSAMAQNENIYLAFLDVFNNPDFFLSPKPDEADTL